MFTVDRPQTGLLSHLAMDKRLTSLLRGVYALFFVSGALSLIYEVLWLRRLLLVFGSTVHAVSTVLTVFFGGLALGSWIFGRLIDRRETAGLLWYAVLEAAIGVYAFVTLPLFQAIEGVYIPWYRASGFSPAVLVGASFLCSAAILLIPTTLMGGTFPIVSRFLIRTAQERGVKIASLYGINTFGAMAGTLFVYYVALQRLGWMRSLVCAGLVNLLIGVVASALHRNLQLAGFRTIPMGRPQAGVPEADLSRRAVRWLLLAFGLSGFSAMVYEVSWTRSLSLVLGSSIYAFCIMLATFLGGMALGSVAARHHLRRKPASLGQFASLEVCLAAYGLSSIPLFSWLPDWFLALWPLFGNSFAGWSWLQVTLSVFVMALPTFFMGLLFPLVSELVTGHFVQLGRRVGLAYALNTLGGILGSFLSGFWLIPHLGIAQTIAIAAIINLLAALVIYLRFDPARLLRRLSVAFASLAICVGVSQRLFVPSWQRDVLATGVFLNPGRFRALSAAQVAQQSELLFYRDSLNATVSVHRDAGTRQLSLKVGGKTDASTGVDMGTQVLAAHIPLLLHQHAERVLVIGLGSGVTLGSAGRYPVSVLHCAEIDPAVVEGARYFAEHNDRIHDDPRTTIYAADGRNFLLATQAQYDVIISEPSNPWMAGLAFLFTEEFYELCRQRLARGGIMAQWIQLYQIFPADVKLLVKTFQGRFPYTSVWSTVPGDLLLVGSLEPHQLDEAHLQQQFTVPAIKDDLGRVSIGHPRTLTEFFLLGPEQVRKLIADEAWVHQDDLPWLEFSAPKALYGGQWHPVNYQGLEQLKASASPISPHVAEDKPDAMQLVDLGNAYRFREEVKKATEAFERAISLNPSLGVAYLRLGELYAQTGLDLKAQEALEKAAQLDSALVEVHQGLARVLWRQGKREESLRSYERAASMEAPGSAFAEEIGFAFREAKRPLEASEYLRSAVSQGTESRPALFLAVAEASKELRRFDETERMLLIAMERHANEASFPLLLGRVLLEQDRWIEAKRVFEQALTKAPKSPEARFGLGEIAFEQGDLAQAARWLRDGLRYDPYNAKALDMLQAMRRREEAGGQAAALVARRTP